MIKPSPRTGFYLVYIVFRGAIAFTNHTA
jgi:hypothetical protein